MKLFYYLFFVLIIACTSNNNKSIIDTQSHALNTNIKPPTITKLNELPDSLQPITIQLSNTQKPKTFLCKTSITHQLPTSFSLTDSTKTIISPEAQAKGLFTTFTSEDGLTMDGISFGQNTLFVDNTNKIWFATQGGGVCKYDGENFTTYTTKHGLSSNSILCVYQDRTENLWFGTFGGGVCKYDGKNFSAYTTEHGLASNSVLCITEDDSGNLWMGTDRGVSKYNGEKFTNITTDQGLAHKYINCITKDKKGNIWIGTDGGGISKYNTNKTNNHFTTFTTNQGLLNNKVLSITTDENGNIWAGTKNGLSKFDGHSFTNFTTLQGLAYNHVLSIFPDQDGNIWIGTYGGGVSRYNGETFTNFTTDQGLPNNSILCIDQDKNGNLWMGTSGGGVSRYNGKSFTSFTSNEGLASKSVTTVNQDSYDNIWVGTFGGGISKYNGKSITTYTTKQGLPSNSILSVTPDQNGNIWIGTFNDGICFFDGENFTTYTTSQGLYNNSIRNITLDKSGNIWIGTGKGVMKFNGESFITFTTKQGLVNNSIRTIFQDNSGNIWIGTDGGVSIYDGKSFTNFNTDQGLSNNSVFCIDQDQKGNLWMGTYGGGLNILTQNEIKKINFKNSTPKKSDSQIVKFITLTVSNGLPDNGISAIRFNSKGDAIIGTNYGIYVISNHEVNQITNNKISNLGKLKGETFNQFNGYNIKDVNTGTNNGAILIDKQDKIWVGHSNKGITRVDLNALNKNPIPPIVALKNLQLKNEDICYYSLNTQTDSLTLSQQEISTYKKILTQQERDSIQHYYKGVKFDSISKWYPLPQNLVLPYKHNALTFEYNAIETDRNFMVNYQYMLKGSNNDWGPITKKKEATYTNLTEGKYTFLLRAQSPWEVWSTPIEFSFTILPPWYRTWWAYLGYLVISILTIWSLVNMQTKKLKQRQAELEVEVENATKEITKTLKVVEQQKEKVEEAHKEITDSINYAERIQRSFLATDDMLTENLGEHFVFFKPKDVVSGDFYWADTLSNGTFAMVNADSTGHGVPGAIMSILNISSIENAIKEGLTNPADIFNSTRQTIIERLKKDGSKEGGKDGMDASIICFDFKNLKMNYCTAQNPIWVIRNGEVIQIKPEKMPVGKHDHDHIPFVGGEFQLEKGDQVYTLTDGFQDQFGGPKGKKFMVKRLRNFVLENSHLPMTEQYQKLEKALTDWMIGLEQVDDVCVIGICI